MVYSHASDGKQTVARKTERPGFGPASYRLAETFSLIRSLSSPQQPNAVNAAFYSEIKFRQCKKTCIFLYDLTGSRHRSLLMGVNPPDPSLLLYRSRRSRLSCPAVAPCRLL